MGLRVELVSVDRPAPPPRRPGRVPRTERHRPAEWPGPSGREPVHSSARDPVEHLEPRGRRRGRVARLHTTGLGTQRHLRRPGRRAGVAGGHAHGASRPPAELGALLLPPPGPVGTAPRHPRGAAPLRAHVHGPTGRGTAGGQDDLRHAGLVPRGGAEPRVRAPHAPGDPRPRRSPRGGRSLRMGDDVRDAHGGGGGPRGAVVGKGPLTLSGRPGPARVRPRVRLGHAGRRCGHRGHGLRHGLAAGVPRRTARGQLRQPRPRHLDPPRPGGRRLVLLRGAAAHRPRLALGSCSAPCSTVVGGTSRRSPRRCS